MQVITDTLRAFIAEEDRRLAERNAEVQSSRFGLVLPSSPRLRGTAALA